MGARRIQALLPAALSQAGTAAAVAAENGSDRLSTTNQRAMPAVRKPANSSSNREVVMVGRTTHRSWQHA